MVLIVTCPKGSFPDDFEAAFSILTQRSGLRAKAKSEDSQFLIEMPDATDAETRYIARILQRNGYRVEIPV